MAVKLVMMMMMVAVLVSLVLSFKSSGLGTYYILISFSQGVFVSELCGCMGALTGNLVRFGN